MTVQNHLSPTLPVLATGDTVGHALFLLAEHGVEHLPVVGADGKLVALVSEEALGDFPSPETPLAALLGATPISATPDTHVFDAAQLVRTHALSVLPVASADGMYLGNVAAAKLLGRLAQMLAAEEVGAIVVAEIARRDHALGRLAQLVEDRGTRILSVSTEDDPTTETTRVTLKLNVTDSARVRHVLEHVGYRVLGVFDESDGELQERVDAFLRYLEV